MTAVKYIDSLTSWNFVQVLYNLGLGKIMGVRYYHLAAIHTETNKNETRS